MRGAAGGALALAVLALTPAPRVAAQPPVADPASLLALGRVAAAESAYYAAVRANPRDPVARERLGVFLAARGAPRVGAVLLEEALTFGGDSSRLIDVLARLYARSGDYEKLAALASAPLRPDERQRVAWLGEHQPRVVLRDSVARLSYRAGRGRGLGTVLLRVGGTELAAVIEPGVAGAVLPAALRGATIIFGDSTSTVAAVTLRVGTLSFENVPVTLAPAGEQVRLGFDVLAPYSPTFEPSAGMITLHRPERRWRPPPGTRVPALSDERGMWLLFSGAWTLSSAPNAALLLASRAWTWDARRGDVVLLTSP